MMSEGGAEGKSSGVRVPFLSMQHTSSVTTGKKEVMMRTGFAKSYAPSRHPTDSKKHFKSAREGGEGRQAEERLHKRNLTSMRASRTGHRASEEASKCCLQAAQFLSIKRLCQSHPYTASCWPRIGWR